MSKQEQSQKSPSARGIYWHCQHREHQASSCQADWGVERKTSHSPPRCQVFHKPLPHRCQLWGGIHSSPACDFASHWRLCSTQRVAQAYRGLQIHLCGEGASCLSWHEGRRLGNEASFRGKMSTGANCLASLLLVALGCPWLLSFIMLWHLASHLGMKPQFSTCINARQRRDCYLKAAQTPNTFLFQQYR